MKSYLLITAIFAVAVIFLPTKAYSQVTNTWNSPGNVYIRSKIMSGVIMNSAKKKRSVKKRAVSKRKNAVRRKTRRVSMLENFVIPGIMMKNLPQNRANIV